MRMREDQPVDAVGFECCGKKGKQGCEPEKPEIRGERPVPLVKDIEIEFARQHLFAVANFEIGRFRENPFFVTEGK